MKDTQVLIKSVGNWRSDNGQVNIRSGRDRMKLETGLMAYQSGQSLWRWIDAEFIAQQCQLGVEGLSCREHMGIAVRCMC